MKKLIAVMISLVLVLSFSVVAFAADSPSGTVVRTVTVINGANAKGAPQSIPVGQSVTVTADSSKGTFNSWKVYKADGSAAVAGTDYTVSAGSLTATSLTITPLTDLIICGNYNGTITDPITGAASKAPQTGDFTVVYFGIAALAALAFGVTAKKQLAK